MILLRKRPRRLLLLPKLKSDCGSGPFFQTFLTQGPKEKRRYLPESTAGPWPLLAETEVLFKVINEINENHSSGK